MRIKVPNLSPYIYVKCEVYPKSIYWRNVP